MKQVAMHCYIAGKVQGVWFRANTKAEADKLGVTGWVRNLPDGRVEVMAYGDENQMAVLREWLNRGPPRAQVTEVVTEAVKWQEENGFRVL